MIYALRAAITAAGGTPTQFTEIALLHELIAAWGGTATQFTIEGLLREAIVASGGTPTHFAFLPLLKELIVARGGEATSFILDDLISELVSVSGASGLSMELVQNGDFSTTEAWTASGPSISGGALQVSEGEAYQAAPMVPGATYQTSFTIVGHSSGSARLVVGGTPGTYRNAAGTYEEDIVAGSSGLIKVEGDEFSSLVVDDVSVVSSYELNALSLSNSSVNENTASGVQIGWCLAVTEGSTLELVDDAGGRFKLDSPAAIDIGTADTPLDHETASSHQITIRETFDGAVNSPRDNVLTITVVDVPD